MNTSFAMYAMTRVSGEVATATSVNLNAPPPTMLRATCPYCASTTAFDADRHVGPFQCHSCGAPLRMAGLRTGSKSAPPKFEQVSR